MFVPVVAFVFFINSLLILLAFPVIIFSFPVASASGGPDNFLMFSRVFCFVVAYTYALYFLYIKQFSIVKRFLLMLASGAISYLGLIFFINIASKFINLFPITPKTLSGMAILFFYLLILAIIITPGYYILNETVRKKYSSNYASFFSLADCTVYRNQFIIGCIISVLCILFLFYNIVYQNKYIFIIYYSICGVYTSCSFPLFIKFNPKLSTRAITLTRVISILVLCISLTVAIITMFV